jgi:16S rRNA pseudouridine516 synthase
VSTAPARVGKPVRLDRLLANCGEGSRSHVDMLIRRGQVSVAEVMQRDPGFKVGPHQFEAVTLDGHQLDRPHGVTVVLNKPVGYSCSHDEREAPLVDELLPDAWAGRTPRPEWAGRLDRDTSGLLLISDDHQLVHRLTSPKHHVDKVYEVKLAAALPDPAAAVTAFASGALMLENDDRPCRPADLTLDDSDPLRVTVVLREGRFHQVRRMILAVGGRVDTLDRIAFGPWSLEVIRETVGELSPGSWVDVTVPTQPI